jgi:hypothetical protein
MALARTTYTLQVSGDNHGTGAYTTGSFTPPSNSLLVVVAYLMTASGSGGADRSGSLTVSDSQALTWTPRANIGNTNSFALGKRAWTAPVTTGASMTVSVDCGANDIYKYHVHLYAYTGYDTGSPVGATVTSDQGGSSDGNFSITLSSAPASTSEVVAAVGIDPGVGVNAMNHGSGWTEIYETIIAQDSGSQSQVRTGSTSTSVAWGGLVTGVGSVVALALEIKEGVGGGGSPSPVIVGKRLQGFIFS